MREKVFRFALGPSSCVDADAPSAGRASDGDSSSSSNSSSGRRRASRSAKRQRIASQAPSPSAAAGECVVQVRMVELIRELQDMAAHDDTTHYGLFIWPSAMVLAHAVAHCHASLVRDKVVMELGCGTGLPGILAAVCGAPKAVYLTDRSDATDIQRNVEANITLNGIGDAARFVALDWGEVVASESLLRIFETVDVLLAADCFYHSEDFEKVLASVALIFRCSPKCRLYVTYQLRSITRSIAPLLARWRMQATALDTAAFLPHDDVSSSAGDEDGETRRQQGFESVFLYEISPRR